MATVLDILGSIVIGSILVLISIRAMDNALRRFVNHNADAIVQSSLIGTTEIIQNDLWKMGYMVPEEEQDSIIIIAQMDHLKYLTFLDNNDTLADTIEYEITAFDTIDFIDTSLTFFGIERTIINTQSGTNAGQIGTITNNDVFQFFNQIGGSVVLNQEIKMVEVTLIATNPQIYLSEEVLLAQGPVERMVELRKLLKEAYWRQTRVISKNLRR